MVDIRLETIAKLQQPLPSDCKCKLYGVDWLLHVEGILFK